MIRRPPRSTLSSSSAASDVYKRQVSTQSTGEPPLIAMGCGASRGNFTPESPLEFTYFGVFAKGLGPVLCLQLSGLDWTGHSITAETRHKWVEMKEAGKAPFGQLPILQVNGETMAQTVAICNFIGRVAEMEGVNEHEFALSQMLMCEAEDLYNKLQKFNPTVFVPLGGKGSDGSFKSGAEGYKKWWAELLPGHLANLEKLLGESDKFSESGTTVGELYLWSMLHQIALVTPSIFENFMQVGRFYQRLLVHEEVSKVVEGKSAFGPWAQYFIEPEAE
eukprot:TRINITY_DN12465_c0_g1_i5.p1 TRINITY_DN12465_c0_g1~~TRINITY_DN12465_c0_g1_i5.p1  ORF type:complete len:277 (+),score=78.44 TRINITY_DN12465_c0_g1_i5:108-938(+)